MFKRRLIGKLREIALVLLIGVPLVVAMNPFVEMHYLREAARKGNLDVLAERVDFPSVRQSLKAQLDAGFDGHTADRVIDLIATPAGIQQLMMGARTYARSATVEPAPRANGSQHTLWREISSRYESIDRFVVTLQAADGESIGLVLHRVRGTARWKLAEIRLPRKE